jgi:hypothetical protein
MAPGTVTACGMCVSIFLIPALAYHSAVAALGALPEALKAMGFCPGLAMIAKQSPPMPVIAGSVTHITAVAVIAASMALPPCLSISIAARLASGCEVAHMARVPMTCDRPGKWKLRIETNLQ